MENYGSMNTKNCPFIMVLLSFQYDSGDLYRLEFQRFQNMTTVEHHPLNSDDCGRNHLAIPVFYLTLFMYKDNDLRICLSSERISSYATMS